MMIGLLMVDVGLSPSDGYVSVYSSGSDRIDPGIPEGDVLLVEFRQPGYEKIRPAVVTTTGRSLC